MEKKNRICAYKGYPVNPGVSRKTTGINFAVEIPCGISASLVLYRKGAALRKWKFLLQKNTGQAECAQY